MTTMDEALEAAKTPVGDTNTLNALSVILDFLNLYVDPVSYEPLFDVKAIDQFLASLVPGEHSSLCTLAALRYTSIVHKNIGLSNWPHLCDATLKYSVEHPEWIGYGRDPYHAMRGLLTVSDE